jgi:hypothetical protein
MRLLAIPNSDFDDGDWVLGIRDWVLGISDWVLAIGKQPTANR